MNYEKLTSKKFLTKTDDLNKCVENVYNTKLTFVFLEATYKNPAIINSQLNTNFPKSGPVNNTSSEIGKLFCAYYNILYRGIVKNNQDYQFRTSAKTTFSSWISAHLD